VAEPEEWKEWERRLRSKDPGSEVVHPHAARLRWAIGRIASRHGRTEIDPEPVRRSECFTADLHRTRVTGLMRKSGPICYARDFGASRTRRMSLAIFLI